MFHRTFKPDLMFDMNMQALLATLSPRAHITNTDCFSASFVNVFRLFLKYHADSYYGVPEYMNVYRTIILDSTGNNYVEFGDKFRGKSTGMLHHEFDGSS